MRYVDGYVIPIPKKKTKAYVKMAKIGYKMWKKHGALDYKECIGDDLKSPWGKTFPKGVRTKAGENVVFSYIVFKSRTHRNQVNAKVMKEMEKLGDMSKDMPFNPKRMIYGGFKVAVG